MFNKPASEAVKEIENLQTVKLFNDLQKGYQTQTQSVLTELQAAIDKFPKVTGGQQYFSSRTNTIFQDVQKIAEKMEDEYTSTEHILIAIAAEKEGDAGRILRSNGVSSDDVDKVITEMRGGSKITDQNAERDLLQTGVNQRAVGRSGQAIPSLCDVLIGDHAAAGAPTPSGTGAVACWPPMI